jgi:hypothetical protein
VQDEEDPAYCDPDSTGEVEARPATDLETLLRLYFSATSKERITVEVNYHDEDVSRGGRDWSYTYYYTATRGDLSGGARLFWALRASTRRIPRVVVSAMVKQIFEDSYRFNDRFDHSWYTWLRLSANLSPGPQLVARFKYYDEGTTTDPNRKVYPDGTPKTGFISRCDWEQGLSNDELPDALPGSCRGETYIDAYLQLTQKLPVTMFAGSLVRFQLGWTRWLDHRKKWSYGVPPCDLDPPRDELLMRGYLLVKF